MCSLFAQRGNQRDLKPIYDLGKRFYSDIYILPDSSSDSVLVYIPFKMTYQTLTFIVKPDNGNEKYLAVPSIEVEFKDSESIIRKRIFYEDSVLINSYEKTVSKDEYLYGIVETKMKTGKYTVNINLRCSNSQLQKNKNFPLVDFSDFRNSLAISEPILASSLETDRSNTITPYILNLGIPFSSNGASILVPVSYKNEYDKFKCTVKYTKMKDKLFDWGDIPPITGSVVPLTNSSLKIEYKNQFEIPILKFNSFQSDSGLFKQGLLNIHLTSDKLIPGNYELNIVRENSKDTLKRIISVIWEDMPVILMNPESAVESMYYILTDDQYDKMNDGNQQEMSKKLIDYWKEKDPTKTTAFNEAMAEYFKRVDYTNLNFKSKNYRDGFKSEQGKIYILYGPPTKTSKVLGEKQNTEIWIYDKLKKEFIFKTDNSGNYILVNVNDIK